MSNETMTFSSEDAKRKEKLLKAALSIYEERCKITNKKNLLVQILAF